MPRIDALRSRQARELMWPHAKSVLRAKCARLGVLADVWPPAHVPMRDQNGDTALILAACHGSAECVAALLAVDGIDVNVQDTVRHSGS